MTDAWLMGTRMAVGAAAVLAAVTLTLGPGGLLRSEDHGTGELPVITPSEPWNSYPTAAVDGDLTLDEGCLLLDGEVAFWPHGTEWEASAQVVRLENQASAWVGEHFSGGGGHYDADTDFPSWLGAGPGEAILDCLDATGASGVVFAH